ncbi:hypothetical protein [Viridibacillus arvi]|uniref:hypothetical protein n=1 Tax=Viridibacillus arvi TaxID=263475 RepID=UPI003D26BB60
MKKNSKIMAGILSLGLLTTGVLSVQADTIPTTFDASVPGLNNSTTAGGGQRKVISNKDAYLNIYKISGNSKLDARAETGVSKGGPWVRLSGNNFGIALENSIQKGETIHVRFSSDLLSYLPIKVTGDFQGN